MRHLRISFCSPFSCPHSRWNSQAAPLMEAGKKEGGSKGEERYNSRVPEQIEALKKEEEGRLWVVVGAEWGEGTSVNCVCFVRCVERVEERRALGRRRKWCKIT